MPNFKTPVGECNAYKTNTFTLRGDSSYNVKPAHCQRDYCWTSSQYKSFMQHAMDCGSLGEFIIITVRKDLFIVDGQHRLKALADFKNDVFPIKDVDTGEEWFYSQLPISTKRFDVEDMPCYIREIRLKEYDAELAERIYNGYNFGGVKH